MTLRIVQRAVTAADTLPATPGWNATLNLAYERRAGRTVLVKNQHSGPLVVQKSLYPEGDAVCHTVVLHPPGGIAGGDELAIAVDTATDSRVLLTTPGATKWYKSNGRPAAQRVALRIGRGAIVEWLPLEAIVFDGADAQSTLSVELAAGAVAAGWEVVAFGRTASGERFDHGRFRQSVEIRRGGELLWAEYGDITGGDALLDSPVGYAGRTVSGLFWICGAPMRDDLLASCRVAQSGRTPRMLAGVTCLPGGILLARCLADSTEQVRRHLLRLWTLLRPHYAGTPATVPRLWAT
ncbi:MAG: urease accessory protein UreD [Betaproteobacteria bacterium]